jgi:phosphoserine phosphatase
MTSTSIYLVRHGQTAWNREEIFRGRTDVPLDETGLKQAELAAGFFKGMDIHAIYSSPLSRAMETARKISELHQLEVRPFPGIIDMNFGKWEGKSVQEIREKDGGLYRQWVEEPQLLKIPGGETLDEVMGRSMAALDEVIRSHFGKTIVLVSHRVINKAIICGVLGLDNSHFWQMFQDPTSINLIRHTNGKYVLSFMNETCHLKCLQQAKRIDS